MRRPLKCRKCGSTYLMLTERYRTALVDYRYDDGTITEKDTMIDDPIRVWANCDCGHSWTLSRIKSVEELRS